MLIQTFAGFDVRLESKSHWAAAANTCGCVLTCAVTASVIHRTCFWGANETSYKGQDWEI